MIQLVISSTIIEQVSLETACIHSKFHLVETAFPLSLTRCAWHESRRKRRRKVQEIFSCSHSLSSIPWKDIPPITISSLSECFGIRPDLRSSQAVGSAIGLLTALQQKWAACGIALLLWDRTGCNTEVMVSLPWYCVVPQRLVRPSWLHNSLCLGWLSYVSPHMQLQQNKGEVSTFSWHPLWPLRQPILIQGVPVMEIAWLLVWEIGSDKPQDLVCTENHRI